MLFRLLLDGKLGRSVLIYNQLYECQNKSWIANADSEMKLRVGVAIYFIGR